MPDEKDLLAGLHRIMDKAEPVVEGVARVLSHVHIPGEDTRSEDVIDAEIVSETPAIAESARPPMKALPPPPLSIVFGAERGPDGRGMIFHAFRQIGTSPLCERKLRERPEVWWRPNSRSREAILFCFGCLSHLEIPHGK